MNNTFRHVVVAGIAILVAACASAPEIAKQSVKANLAVEQAHNQILLLNIVRAYHRRPMYFTGLTMLNGPIGAGRPSFSLATPFGPDFTNNIYSLTTSYTPDVASFQIGVYDSQEFIRGLMKPVEPSIVFFYLDQGWPQEMILHLLVREIEIVNENGEATYRYVNYPPNKQDFSRFQKVVAGLSSCELVLDMSTVKKQYGPDIPAAQLADPTKLAASKTADFAIDPVDKTNAHGTAAAPDAYRISRVRQEPTFKLRPRLAKTECIGVPDEEGRSVNAAVFGNSQEKQRREEQKEATGNEKKPSGTRSAIFGLRSPEAIIYYLGELSRTQNNPTSDALPMPATIGFDFPREYAPEALFVLKKNAPDASEAVLSVDYEGASYSIPKDGGRSTHVLSLLSQLIGLQKKASDLPATTTVRLVP